MFAPCSANVRATSSSSRERSQASTAIWTRKPDDAPPSHSTSREALGIPLQRPDVRAVLAVHGDPATHRDVADDRVAGDGRAALREAHEHVLDAGDVDADAIARDGLAARARLRRDDRARSDLLRLQPLDDLVDDLRRGELPGAERDVEVLRLLESGLADDLGEHARALQLAVRAASAPSGPGRAGHDLSPPSRRASRAGTTGGSCCGRATR